MKLFLVKIFIFSISTFIIYNLYYQNRTRAAITVDNSKVYVWGDSQTVQGLDFEILRNKTNLEFYSMAVHGGGIYDFACFANLVPKNSKVIIGYSDTMFLRPEGLDYNKTRLDWNAIFYAGLSGYSISTLKNIVLKNYRPRVVFPKRNQNLYVGSSINFTQKEEIKKIFLLGSELSKVRIKYFHLYIEKLKEKGCSIIVLQIPKSDLLYQIESEVSFLNSLNLVKKSIIEISDEQKELNLEFSQSDFYDVTHLNQKGAKSLSVNLASFLNSQKISKEAKITFLTPSD